MAPPFYSNGFNKTAKENNDNDSHVDPQYAVTQIILRMTNLYPSGSQPEDLWPHLETFLVLAVLAGQCYWYLVGGGQGSC